MPCWATLALSELQSQSSLGLTPHMSNWKMPCEAGEPSYVSYGPSRWAISHEASRAAW